MKLLVDCDDTLIKWKDGPIANFDEWSSTDWEWHQPLIDYLMNPNLWDSYEHIIVWSGGGLEYAQLWLNRLENHVRRTLPFVAMSKDIRLIQDGDVCIDDQPLIKPGANYTMVDPRSF